MPSGGSRSGQPVIRPLACWLSGWRGATNAESFDARRGAAKIYDAQLEPPLRGAAALAPGPGQGRAGTRGWRTPGSGALLGEDGYPTGKDAEAVACDAPTVRAG
jgi:hypothetical protein